MTELRWNPNNTEGAWLVSYDFIDTEVRKGAKIVATVLTDLYDVEITNVQDEEVLLYDGGIEKWINGPASGGCNIITENTEFTVGDEEGSQGTFSDLKNCFDWLRENCIIIAEDVILTIRLISDQNVNDYTSLNYPYGHRVEINYDNNSVYSLFEFPYYGKLLDIKFTFIACGKYHSILIGDDGTLWGTGYNSYGQLGLEDYVNRKTFTQIGTDTDWVDVAGGYRHTLAIKSDGTLWGTGYNYRGQLGLGDNDVRNIFTQIGTDTDWVDVAGGYNHSMAIKEDGRIYGTGYNSYGQLGLGDNDDRNIFTQAGTDTNWSSVSCGNNHTMALKNGHLYGTGYNYYGQLGLNNNNNRNVFTEEYYKFGIWVHVSCGSNHTMTLRYDNRLYGTGYNSSGQLGLGHNNNRNVLIEMSTIGWSKVTCGGNHSIAIKTNGTLWGTGYNYYGQLGLGHNYNRNLFNPEISFGSLYDGGWSSYDIISAGEHFSISIKINNYSLSTGRNSYGELGLGNNSNVNIYTSNAPKEKYISKETVNEIEEAGIYINDGNNIKKMYNGRLSNTVYLNEEGTETECIYKLDDYSFNLLNVINNSITYLDDFSFYIYNSDVINNIVNVENNSYLKFIFVDNDGSFYNNKVMNIKNGSTFRTNDAPCILTVVNSTVLSDRITSFNNSTFINSKLIEYK